MTISVVNVESLQTGDGSTTVFNGPVAVRAEDVAVYFWGGDDFVTLSNGEDFEVTGVGTGNRCTVTITNEDYVPDYDSDGTFLSILSEAEYTQETNIPSTRLTVTDSIELSIDLLTILTQQLDAKLTRSLRTDSRDFPMDGVLPLRGDRAGKVLSFDSEGNPVATNDLTDILGSLAVYDGETLIKSNTRTLNFRNGVSAVALESGQVAIDLSFPDGDSLPAQSYDLILDGETDQTDEFVSLMDSLVASGSPFNLVGLNDGTSELFLGKRAVIDQMPKDSSIDRVSLVLDTSNQAGIYIRGQQIELPESGKAKLWADVDVSGGAVTSFDISVSANPDIVDLLVAGATVRIRGENGADGEALEGHSHEDTVVSCVLVSGTRYTLTLTNGLPDTVDGSVWKTEWPDSSHTVDPDETLISVLASAKATADMTNSRSMSIDSGKAADLGLEAGQWVEIIDDAVGSDFHGTSNEPLNRQIVKVHSVTAGVDPTDDVITFDDVIMGSYTTAKNARLIMLRECTQFKLRGPGVGFPIRTVGTPPASPESRRHAIEVAYAVRPEITGWVYEYDASDGSTRGTIIRDSVCLEPWVHHNIVIGPTPNFAGAFNGGDYYCAWSKGSTRPLVENNIFLGGRHAYVMANAKGGAIRFNNLGLSGFQNLDLHGENEQGVHVYGNRIVRGPKWTDRSNHIAIQFGNQTHTYGTRGAVCYGNEFIGFDDDDDVGVLVISGCKDISIDEEFLDSIGIGVQIEADRRAPEVLIERISIDGSAPGATIGVVIDGRMQLWTSEGEVFGSASRPTYIDDSTGTLRYVTGDEGVLGTVNPTHTTGTESNGDIDLEYVGLVAEQTVPIDGVRILADLSNADTDVVQNQADNVVYGSPLPINGNLRVVQLRHGTAAELASANPTLEEGEGAFETDTGIFKIGVGDDYNDTDPFGALLNSATQVFEELNPTVAGGETTIDDSFLSAAVTIDTNTLEVRQRIVGMIDTGDTSADFTANLAFGDALGGQTVIVFVPASLTGTVTLRSADHATGGLIDGVASRVMPANGMFVIRRLTGSTKQYRTSIIDNPSFAGLVTFNAGIKAGFLSGVSGTLTMASHSGRTIIIDGDTTIPVEDGFSCRIISDGANDVDAGGTAVSLTNGQSIIVFTDGTTVYRSAVETLLTMLTS